MEKERSRRKERLVKASKKIFVVFLTMGFIGTFGFDYSNFLARFLRTSALTTPWGVVYFTDNPSDFLMDHEQCHYQRLKEIGPLVFYLDYFFGGACAEEVRCGADPANHPVCGGEDLEGN